MLPTDLGKQIESKKQALKHEFPRRRKSDPNSNLTEPCHMPALDRFGKKLDRPRNARWIRPLGGVHDCQEKGVAILHYLRPGRSAVENTGNAADCTRLAAARASA
jgi:hypothetical protein